MPLLDATPTEIARLDEALGLLDTLRPGELAIPRATYARLTRFEARFGFPLDGARLCRWISSRARRLRVTSAETAATWSGGEIGLGPTFFAASPAERLYALVHEARHFDGPDHVPCPPSFPYVSARQPEMDLGGAEACDADDLGAYGFQAALLFELYAFGLLDPVAAGLLYNSSAARVLAR